jgi:hypothetical protein
MRITDPAWPAVQEAARMILREGASSIMAPDKFHKDLIALVLKMGDTMPARQQFPQILSTELDVIILNGNPAVEQSPLLYCGPEAMFDHPTTLWIPHAAREFMELLLQSMDDLLEAGYPGCLGCGGPGAEEEWDESASRRRMNLES